MYGLLYCNRGMLYFSLPILFLYDERSGDPHNKHSKVELTVARQLLIFSPYLQLISLRLFRLSEINNVFKMLLK